MGREGRRREIGKVGREGRRREIRTGSRGREGGREGAIKFKTTYTYF